MTMQCFRHCNQFLGLLPLPVVPQLPGEGGRPLRVRPHAPVEALGHCENGE